MPEDHLRDVVNSIRTRLQAELDAQLEALTERQTQAVDRARQSADADAEERWGARLAALTEQHQRTIADERRAAEAEVEQRWSAKLAAVTEEHQRAVAEERRAAEAEAEKRWTAQLEALTESQNQAAERVRQAAEADAEKRWSSQIYTLTESRDKAEASARQAAESEADRRWEAKLESARAEWSTRLASEVAAARSEVERAMGAESMRVRVDDEQKAAEAASQAQRELDELRTAVAAERETTAQAQRELDELQAAVAAERETTSQALAEAQRARDTAEAALNSAWSTPAPAAARTQAPDAGALLEALRAIDNATSLSTALAAALRGAAAEAPRAALFVVSGTELREWPVPGVPTVHAGVIRVDGREAGVVGEAVRRNETISHTGNGTGAGAPAFASLPPDRAALAVPFVLGGQPVAVLYADEGHDGVATAAWCDSVQILGRHASACVAHLTAERTAQAMRLMAGTASPSTSSDDDQGARRYARLLVSEIKLYNESAVRAGREKGDLLQRLRPEIDRARRMYDERIHPQILARDAYFQQELVQTLADGDASLLGSPQGT